MKKKLPGKANPRPLDAVVRLSWRKSVNGFEATSPRKASLRYSLMQGVDGWFVILIVQRGKHYKTISTLHGPDSMDNCKHYIEETDAA